MGEDTIRELIEFIVRALVDRPEKVSVREVKGLKVTVLELRVAKEDMGRVIGKNGRTAMAIRTLLHATGTKAGRVYNLEIVED